MTRYIDLTGKLFGALAVLHRAGRQHRYATWMCQCSCGERVEVRSDRLLRGLKVTCGKSGHRGIKKSKQKSRRDDTDAEYRSWQNMRSRCFDPRRKNYGERGIAVCKRWQDSFENFLADMGRKPTPLHTIERMDVNGNYEPGNCRWATRAEQAKNQRRSVYVDYRGERILLVDLADRYGVPRSVLYGRLSIGWDVERALQKPVRFAKKGELRQKGLRKKTEGFSSRSVSLQKQHWDWLYENAESFGCATGTALLRLLIVKSMTSDALTKNSV